MTPENPRDARSDALEVFAGWLSRRENGDTSEFEELLRLHPTFAPELEDLHATWKGLAEVGNPSLAGRSVHAEIVERFGEDADSKISLHGERKEESSSDFATARISELAARSGSFGRYEIEGEVARGGMGAILRVWDEDLRRHLAMKVVLDGGEVAASSGTSRVQPRTIARFLEEAQVTGQLDHPGIVPVHELGLDSQGRVYFTMKLVEGRDLKQIFALVFDGREGWNETRALGVILKVCEAVAYAHKKGVIHRDLKPANVMVGSFGEVFVMDWGLARVLGRRDTHDLRLAPDSGARGGSVRSDRREEVEAVSDSPLVTLDGDVVGTPAYMPPEQARGEVEKLSPRSDVYSIGAMLYHLLARQMPYVPPGARVANRAVLVRVLSGPPKPLHELNESVPAELAAICEKAMAREAKARYSDTLALAEDLRAYLEHRVVGAYETGAVAELKKWIARNRALAAACAAAIVILAAGLVVSSALFVKARDETTRADAKASEADEERRLAQRRADDVLSLSASKDLQDLVARADALWPAHPENIGKYEDWLRDAHALIEGQPADPAHGVKAKPGLEDHRKKLGELEARALPRSAAERAAETESLERQGSRSHAWSFASRDDGWWHAQLSILIADLEAFSDPKTGLCSGGTSPGHSWGIEKRLEMARTIEERSVWGSEAAKRWEEAMGSIRDRSLCPKYDGLAIKPQLGLLPIGRDPASGLWEFAHLETGEPAERGADGKLLLKEGTGLVLVLIPAGQFLMGTQKTDPSGPNYFPQSPSEESPMHEVVLDAYFLSKYEMTQDQWLRFMGRNPSTYGPGSQFGEKQTTLLHPVEQVSWMDATAAMSELDLALPTEAQWEYGARAGTSTLWWTGSDMESLRGAANLAASSNKSAGGTGSQSFGEWLDDGYKVHAPVGSFRANTFGLHDVIGNLWELCRDGWGTYDLPPRAGDGERGVDLKSRMIRGGSYFTAAGSARSAMRQDVTPDYHDFNLGLRPARSLMNR